MSTAEINAGFSGLQFFGRVTASISHELKNSLAIIRESAGLMEDLIALDQGDRPVEPERLQKLAQRINRQTVRADETIKNLNRFAHSVDHPLKSVVLDEVVTLMATVGQRLASMHGLSLTTAGGSSTASLQTSPFLMLQAIWQVLEVAFTHSMSDSRIEIRVESAAPGAKVFFLGFATLNNPAAALAACQARVSSLGAEVVVDPASGAAILKTSPVALAKNGSAE